MTTSQSRVRVKSEVRRIGFHTASVVMAKGWPSPSPREVAEMANKLGMGMELMPLQSWYLKDVIAQIPKEQVISICPSFALGDKGLKGILTGLWFQTDWQKNMIHGLRRQYSDAKEVSYYATTPAYGHPSQNFWSQEDLWNGRIGSWDGVIMDTGHTLESTNSFVQLLLLLYQRNIPILFHLQPSRWNGPLGNFKQNWEEIRSFVAKPKASKLGQMMEPLVDMPETPVIIELEPKPFKTTYWLKKVRDAVHTVLA